MKLRSILFLGWLGLSLLVYADTHSSAEMFQAKIEFLEQAIVQGYYFSSDVRAGDFFIKPPMMSMQGWASHFIAYDLGLKSKDEQLISRFYVDENGLIQSFSVPVLKKKNLDAYITASVGVVWYEVLQDINAIWLEHDCKKRFAIKAGPAVFEVTYQPSFKRFVCNRV